MKRFLIIQTAFLGDVVLATPLIEKLYDFYPGAKIDFLVKKGNESLLLNHPKLNHVFIFDKGKNKLSALYKLINEIRMHTYDSVINLHRFASSGLITLFTKADIKIGFDKNPFSLFYDEVVKHTFEKDIHEIDRNLKLIKLLTEPKPYLPKLYPNETDFNKINEITGGKSDYIVFAPTSVWFTKQLPFHKSVELINKYSSKKIFLIGAQNDFNYCQRLMDAAPHANVVNLCGKLTLLQSAALIKKAEMTFVNDSAPLHLASAMNAPVTVFYCSTVPEFGFGPLSSYSKILQVEGLDCKPCGLHGYKTCPKKHFKCGEINLADLNPKL